MFRMDVIRKLKEPGYVLLGADIGDIKNDFPYLDLKLALTDMVYMDFVKESLLMQNEAWGHFRYLYTESRVFGLFDGHMWIKARIYEEPSALEAYKELREIDKNWKYRDLLDKGDDSVEEQD